MYELILEVIMWILKLLLRWNRSNVVTGQAVIYSHTGNKDIKLFQKDIFFLLCTKHWSFYK